MSIVRTSGRPRSDRLPFTCLRNWVSCTKRESSRTRNSPRRSRNCSLASRLAYAVPVRGLADHAEHAAAHRQPVGSGLLDGPLGVHVAAGDIDVSRPLAGTGRVDVVDDTGSEQLGAAAALRFCALLLGRLDHATAQAVAAWSDDDLHRAVLPAALEPALGE